MKAVLLAGGKGTRLAPYTHVLPKPLVPVGNMPILEIVVRQLIAAGFTDITLTLGYLGEIIRAFFAVHTELTAAANISFVDEKEPTGTAGSLRLVPDLDDTFLAMNGDVLTTLDYPAMIEHHRASGAALTIAGHEKEVNIDLGVLELSGDGGEVVGYNEKPSFTYPVSMGVYIYEPRAVAHIPENSYFDFPSLVCRLLESGEKVSCYRSRDLWLDVGRPHDHEEAQRIIAADSGAFGLLAGREQQP